MNKHNINFIIHFILINIYLKKIYIYKIRLQYLENELRHLNLYSFNPIQMPEISFSMGSKMSCVIYMLEIIIKFSKNILKMKIHYGQNFINKNNEYFILHYILINIYLKKKI